MQKESEVEIFRESASHRVIQIDRQPPRLISHLLSLQKQKYRNTEARSRLADWWLTFSPHFTPFEMWKKYRNKKYIKTGKAGTDRLVANILLVLRKSIFNPSFQVDPISVSVFLLRELIPCVSHIRERELIPYGNEILRIHYFITKSGFSTLKKRHF